MSESTQELKNDRATVTLTRHAGCSVKFDVSLTPKFTCDLYSQAMKKVKKEVSLPGFRKGRAPNNLIEDRFGSYIQEEWHKLLPTAAFEEAMELSGIYPFSKEAIQKVKLGKHSKEEGAEVAIEIESDPEVPEIDVTELTISKIDPEKITEEMIDQSIESLRLRFCEWEEDTADREVQDGDHVNLDIETIDETPETLCTDERFKVDKESLPEWMYTVLLGKKKGDIAEGTFAEEGNEPSTPKNKIVIKSILTSKLPELDEEFLKKINLKSVEDLREQTLQRLEHEAKNASKEQMRAKLTEKLMEKVRFDLPGSLIEEERQRRVKGKIQELKKQNLSDDEILNKEKEIEANVSAEIDKDLRLFFIARKLQEDKKIEISKEDLTHELNHYYPYYAAMGQMEKEEEGKLFKMIHLSVLTRKAKDYYLEQIFQAT